MLVKEGEIGFFSRKAQVTLFVIIALVIVAAAILIFAFREIDTSFEANLPAEIQPAYDNFLKCLEDEALTGIRLLEDQGGYIELPGFEPGSLYSPFSSQLRFSGINVPYWYYVSGNNIQKEQSPSRSLMEEQLSKFIESGIKNCDFDDYYERGFEISLGEPKINTIIQNDAVEVSLKLDLSIEKGFDSSAVKDHKISVNSKLGELYEDAKKIYDKEQNDLFLEEYGVDVLRLYAPVDGVEISCSPLTWSADEVFDNLEKAIEANTLSLKSQGDSRDYFFVDAGTKNKIRFINSRNWSRSFEVNPSDGAILMSKPIGNQPGLGILGFCYVDYHFVYDVKYPVLIQVYSDNEIFQFPIGVVIKGNLPRESYPVASADTEIQDLCQYKNTLIDVNTKDSMGRAIDSDVSYECSNTACYIGRTDRGNLNELFPQCVNGRIIAKAEGYEEAYGTFSTVSPGSVDIFLNKIYSIEVVLSLDGKPYNGQAVISFVSNNSKSIVYPDSKNVDLTYGEYDVEVYIYRNASLEFPSTITRQCVNVPRSGIIGIFGLTEKKCFDVEIPDQIISNVLAGGGSQYYYITQNEIESSRRIFIDAESLPLPKSIDELQTNYILYESRGLNIDFR
ncbi:MAG: hypothetical protein AABW50_01815 [Nanoarchaeota archaeon]